MVENDRVTPIPPRLRPLLDADSPAQQVAGRLVAAGHQCFLVGGSVRDALLEVSQKEGIVDLDLATDARPDEVERLVRGWADSVWLQGQRFGTIGCK
jgi:poly(A) polymerase